MEQFTPKNIALLLIVLGALWIAARGFKSYCDRVDAEWAEENPPPDSPERQHDTAAQHVAKRTSGHSAQILADITGLRRDLPPARNMTGAVQAQYPIHQVEQDERIAKALGEVQNPEYYRGELMRMADRLSARYAGATETEGGEA